MSSLADRVRRVFRGPAGLAYWETRAKTFGPRSVFNLAHAADELELVTATQLAVLLPVLRSLLVGCERVALDFGCGTGRFSRALAETIGGRVVAVDPTQRLLDLAPAHRSVEYRRLDGPIPMGDASADLVWITLVLGALLDEESLATAVSEVTRVLKPGGLLFLVENTAEKPSPRHYRFRSEMQYLALFPTVALRHAGTYEDAGEEISILAGRKFTNAHARR